MSYLLSQTQACKLYSDLIVIHYNAINNASHSDSRHDGWAGTCHTHRVTAWTKTVFIAVRYLLYPNWNLSNLLLRRSTLSMQLPMSSVWSLSLYWIRQWNPRVSELVCSYWWGRLFILYAVTANWLFSVKIVTTRKGQMLGRTSMPALHGSRNFQHWYERQGLRRWFFNMVLRVSRIIEPVALLSELVAFTCRRTNKLVT